MEALIAGTAGPVIASAAKQSSGAALDCRAGVAGSQ